MAPSKRNAKKTHSSSGNNKLPAPLKELAPSLKSFTETLLEDHVYIIHIDSKPVTFKRNIFLVPVGMNIAATFLLIWRAVYAVPYYFFLLAAMFGDTNDTTFPVQSSTWGRIVWEICRRSAVIMFDFLLFGHVTGPILEFFAGQDRGNPTMWRWKVGFREKEIYVRRSRRWDKDLGGRVVEKLAGQTPSTSAILEKVSRATSPTLLAEKTGYVLMGAEWDLDFAAMVEATRLADQKEVILGDFKLSVLFYDHQRGWLALDTGPDSGASTVEDERRRQVFAFRDALAAEDKEDLFYRWVEVVQFESSRPGGFGLERQVEAAKQIREMFMENGIDFDDFWARSVGSDSLAGM